MRNRKDVRATISKKDGTIRGRVVKTGTRFLVEAKVLRQYRVFSKKGEEQPFHSNLDSAVTWARKNLPR